jgi:serralysin
MKSKFITDPQDGTLDPTGDGANTNFFPSSFFPAAGHDGGSPFAITPSAILLGPFPTPPEESVQAQAAQNGPGGPGSVVAVTSATGMTINLQFDAAAMASTPAAAAFRAGIQQAAAILSAAITDKITVTIAIDYSGTGGGAAAGPDTGSFVNYSTVRADLANNATTGDQTFNALPTGTTVQGQSQVAVWDAQLKLFGLALPTNYSGIDGSATFATDINSNLLVGVALHELTHALGRVPYGSQPDIFDLFRFTTSAGTMLFSNGNTAPAAYFSVDGGYTKLADYGQNSDPSDFLNSGVQGGNDPFNEFYTGSTSQVLTTADKVQLDALGFHTLTPVATTVIESFGSTKLVQVGQSFYLDSISSGTGPSLKSNGTPVVAGQYGAGWAPIGAEVTAGGYDVAWKDPVSGQYAVWSTDSNGNYISNIIGVVPGSNTDLKSIETTFHQDLNGDGVIGIPAPTSSVIEAFGSTELVQVGNNFYLDSISNGTGPSLKYAGAAVVAGQFGAATPIGAEQTATGYEVAWKVTGADQYGVWYTDSSGNYISNIGLVSGTSTTLESLETSFHQDLNGDGVIGVPQVAATVIEAFGSTKLVQVGNNYFLDSISTGSGPELMYAGAAVAAGQFGTWTPIGAEQTATGYEVAWKLTGADQYTIWNTDNSGNYITNAIGVVSGSSNALESLETSFHQDLNGDGVIGVPGSHTTPLASLSHAAAGMFASNDKFVFSPGVAAETTDSNELSLFAGNHLASFSSDTQNGWSQTLFQSPPNAGHDTVVDLGNHDGITPTNAHIAELHLNDFIVR